MYIECKKCKYNYDGECDFYSMGSGDEIDMPCYSESEWGIRNERETESEEVQTYK